LRVEGNLVAKVDQLVPISFDGGYSYFDGLAKLLQINAIMEHLNKYRQSLSENPEHVIVRTLLADGAFTQKQPMEYPPERFLAISGCEEAIKAGNMTQDDDAKALEYFQNCSAILQRRRVFVALRGKQLVLGLSNLYVQPGDLVCILYGSKVPVILRPVRESAGAACKVICQCYVDGWMWGDYPDDEWWQKFLEHPQSWTLV
jgi:hypothetical protein